MPEPRRITVDQMLEEARTGLVRIGARRAFEEARAGAVLVDTRTYEQRRAGGLIPGAHVIALNVLEWNLDPASEWHIDEVADHDARVIVLCQEGYSSSLAAARLQRMGLHGATDVVDGFDAWVAAGLPVEPFQDPHVGGSR